MLSMKARSVASSVTGPPWYDGRAECLFEGFDRAEVQVTAHDDRARDGLATDPERPLNQLDLRGLGRIDDARKRYGLIIGAQCASKDSERQSFPGWIRIEPPWRPISDEATGSCRELYALAARIPVARVSSRRKPGTCSR